MVSIKKIKKKYAIWKTLKTEELMFDKQLFCFLEVFIQFINMQLV